MQDLGLQLMGKMVDWYLKASGEHATVLVGTSGDTGSAAIHGVLGCDNVDIVVLYPKGRTSRIQVCGHALVPCVHFGLAVSLDNLHTVRA